MFKVEGYEVIRQEHIAEYAADALYCRHIVTGAEILSIQCADENKVFGVSFKTPPSDSTGVAHILEHSVLCGSRKYPVKEPFVELLKGSLNTFLNAFTYPDKTCYPVASANEEDFYNLIDVYLDAVFFPRINKEIFHQEGWHLDPTGDDNGLSIRGVVYNEMKGAYSAADGVLSEFSQRLLFPNTTYGVDSGGEPAVIPDLTYEAFIDFHKTYYHPGNARIFFYGDGDIERRFAKLDEYLREFGPREKKAAVDLQPLATSPKTHRMPVEPSSPDMGLMMTVSWLFPEITDLKTRLGLHILEHALIGLSSSPLRKALIDSNYGDDLAGVGLEEELRQFYFSTGLKGVAPGYEGKVEKLIISTLQGLAENGIESEAIEAAVNTIEFSLREQNTGAFPRGLSMMLMSLADWLYERDPIAGLRFEAPLAEIKHDLAAGKRVLEDLLNQFILQNNHRVTLILEPDAGLAQRRKNEEQNRIKALYEGLGEDREQRVADDAGALATFQHTPDSAEALASIPQLIPADLPPKNMPTLTMERSADMEQLYFNDLETNGVAYLDLGFDLTVLPEHLFPYINLFGRALLEMGTAKQDAVSLTRRISAKTGGIVRSPSIATTKSGDVAARLFLRGKATVDKFSELSDVLLDILTTANLGNRDRFLQIVTESRTRAEMRLIPAGHSVARLRLGASFSQAGAMNERLSGVEQLFFLRRLEKRVREDFDGVREDLEEIRRRLLIKNAMVANVTVAEHQAARVLDNLAELSSALETGDIERHPQASVTRASAEGLTIAAQVNYVGKAADVKKLGYQINGATHVISRYLRTGYLWERIRVRGGAYGAFSLVDRFNGLVALLSYRDPNTDKTLVAYDEAGAFLEELTLSQEELDKNIVGAVGDLDAYKLPDAKGFSGMIRSLVGDTDEDRQRMREEMFAVTQEDFRAFGTVLRQAMAEADTVIVGAKDVLENTKHVALSLTDVM
ncbi:insulinase family protein [Desulfovibrio inopinatus]|uniref:insulinase family protein n=1 Tax=Desulfovibrio inopinatus TaxID=102109 RepID=UPI00040AE9DA|nr:insulinase family protein [Desulfovibrio inopinatus]